MMTTGENLLINIKDFIASNRKDLCYILLLAVFLLVIAIPKLTSQYHIGIGNWDTFLYLENGRNFAKMGWGDVPSISPVLPMILSKMFLLAGHPYQEAIFNIDVVFYIIGTITFYLLLRLKYEENTSLVGSVIYSTFTLLYSWVAIGGNDIIGVTGTILTVYLIILAHRYNSKIYFIALPVAAYAFLSRYTAGVMIFSILFYWIINRIDIDEIKHIIIGGILGVISIGWFLYQFYIHLGTPFPFLGQFSGTVSNTVVLDSGYLPDSWYYVRHIPNYLASHVPNVTTFNALVNPMGNIPSVIAYVYIVLMVLAFLLMVYRVISTVRQSDIRFDNRNRLFLTMAMILSALFLFTLGSISYIISVVVFLTILYIVWYILKEYEIDYLDYDLLMISLFVIYLVFQSILFTKNDRYFITALPFIAYFITYSLDAVYNGIDKISTGKFRLSTTVSTIVIIVLLANTLLFVSVIPMDNDYNDIEEACSWLSNTHNVTNYTVVYSDVWPIVTWYMNIYCQRGVPNLTDENYPQDFSNEILTNNQSHMAAIYYIDATSEVKVDYPGMVKLDGFDTVQIYQNRYVKLYGNEYVYNDEYNRNIQRDIKQYNRTTK